MSFVQPNPPPAPAPLEGADLLAVIQAFVASLSGIDGTLVRPRWQAEAPVVPSAGTAWAAVGVQSRPGDTFPNVTHGESSPGVGFDQLNRNEELVCLASFYDTGSTGLADSFAALFRDGTAIEQNREQLISNGIFFFSIGDPVAVPSLLHERWLYRVDVPFSLRRTISRQYSIASVEETDVTVEAEPSSGGEQTIPLTIVSP